MFRNLAKLSFLKLALAMALILNLSGCSTIKSWFDFDSDYRTNEAKLAKELEMPPNFLLNKNANTALFTAAVADFDKVEEIPSYKLEGITIDSNLSERWLAITSMDSKDVWGAIQRFVNSEGFAIKEERIDIGLMETSYLARKELAPTELEEGFLTRLFNKWRPEMADGLYDRFIIKLDTAEEGVTKVFFRHNSMKAVSGDETTNWVIRPYDSMIENLALYKALVFLGSSQDVALNQLEAAELYKEIVIGEEFDSLVVNANREQAWQHLQSMIYRANWQVESQNKSIYEMWLVTKPEKKGFFSRLFSSSKEQKVKLNLVRYDKDESKTMIKLDVADGETPLKAKRKKQIFEELGLRVDAPQD